MRFFSCHGSWRHLTLPLKITAQIYITPFRYVLARCKLNCLGSYFVPEWTLGMGRVQFQDQSWQSAMQDSLEVGKWDSCWQKPDRTDPQKVDPGGKLLLVHFCLFLRSGNVRRRQLRKLYSDPETSHEILQDKLHKARQSKLMQGKRGKAEEEKWR